MTQLDQITHTLRSVNTNKDIYKNEAWLKIQHHKKLHSQTEIGKICGVSQTTIGHWLEKFNIKKLSQKELCEPSFDMEKCISMYKSGFGTRTIAEKLNTSRSSVKYWLKDYEIDMHNSGKRVKSDDLIDQVISMYKSGKSQSEIAEEIGVNQTSVSRWLRNNDIETRNQAGWGQICYSNSGLKVKSRLEQRTANKLEELNQSFEYEPNISETSYIPDFILEDNTIIEVFGVTQSKEYNKRSEDKVDKYEDLGYDVVQVNADDNIESLIFEVCKDV